MNHVGSAVGFLPGTICSVMSQHDPTPKSVMQRVSVTIKFSTVMRSCVEQLYMSKITSSYIMCKTSAQTMEGSCFDPRVFQFDLMVIVLLRQCLPQMDQIIR